MNDKKKQSWKWWHSTIWGLFITGLPILAYYQQNQLVGVWWIFMVGFVLILLVTGHGVTGSWKGVLIDERNVMSLSRFQMITWTILVLSAFSAVVFWNIFTATPLGLDPGKSAIPDFPPELWLLMGISTASLVGSPLVLSGKKQQQPNHKEMEKTFELLSNDQRYDKDELDNQGLLVVNKSIDQARWSDLFTGEETGNFAHLDLARLQMFFFTLVSLLTYGVTIGHLLGVEALRATPQIIVDFPKLSEGIIALIGISHTGYLAAKATANSQTGSERPTGEPLFNSSGAPTDDHPAVG
jgi:hypothetical protein